MGFRLLLVASTLSCVFAQAPGDGASLCVEKLYNNGTALVPNPFFSLHPVYRANVRPLMDSRDYVNLLDTPNPVWQQVDNDTNNAADTFSSWTQPTGFPCQQTVLVCGFDKGPQSNWLIFQHISRQLPDGKLLDYVTAQFDFQLNGCDESRQCRQSFDVYQWATSTPDPVAAQNIDNYQQVQRVSPGDTSGTMRTNVSVTIDLMSSNETGVYIAAVDLSTCIILHRVLVFYYVCPADSSNLITRPDTVAPLNSVPGECAENSSPSGAASFPRASCTSNGTWYIITGCECDRGYQEVTEEGIVRNCSATTTVPTYSISPTPSPTTSYSSLQLPVHTPIVPNPPLNLTLTENIDSAVWDPPAAPTEGIIDYDITIYRPGTMLGSVGFTRKTRGRPHYIIRKDNDIPSGTGDICVQVRAITTDGVGLWSKENCRKEPSCLTDCSPCECPKIPCSSVALSSSPSLPIITTPGTVVNIKVVSCNTLDWDAPANDGAEILQYRIRVYNGATYRVAVEKDTFATTVSRVVLNWLPNEGPVYATVRAVNSAGLSEWSQCVTLTETGASNCSALG